MSHIRRRARKVGAPLVLILLLYLIAGLILLVGVASDPAGTLVGFILSSLATLLVVLAYLWVDRWEPEPRRLLRLAFGWGASVAVLLALGLELYGESVFAASTLVSKSFDDTAIRAPFIEEAAKGMFLLIMMTGRRRSELNSLTDCMVYAGITAAGFAWMEDIFYIGAADSSGTLAVVAGLRLIIAPFAHPLFTTMTGIGVYLALGRHSFGTKAGVILLGYLAAVTMHALWNGSLVLSAEHDLLPVIVYLVWFVPVFVLMIVLAVLSRRREQRLVAAKLPDMVAAGQLTANEATWLGSLRGRRAAIHAAKRDCGKDAAKGVAKFGLAAVELAFARDRLDRGFTDQRALALQNDLVQELAATRSAAPMWMTGYRAPVP